MRETVAPPAFATACHLHAQASESVFQNAQLSLNLGELRPATALRETWQRVIAAHNLLRSGFSKSSSGETVQCVSEPGELPWSSHDWTEVPLSDIPDRWNAFLEEDASLAFDITKPPLLRIQSIELPGGHCHQLITFPKLLLDEDTLFHVLCEWLEALDGAPRAVDESPATPEPLMPAVAEWWTRFHAQAAEPVTFTLYPRPNITLKTTRIQSPECLLTRETSRDLKALCQRIAISPREAFLAIWALVLGRVTASKRVTLLAADSQTAPGNLLPCRTSIDNTLPIETWLKAVTKSESDRARNAAIALERCLLLAVPARTLEDFSTAFFWSPPSLNDRLHDAFPRWINADAKLLARSQFPLTLQVRDGNRFALQIEADPAHCPAAEANALLERISRILDAILADPRQKVGDLDLLAASEREALDRPTAPISLLPSASLEEEISTVAERHPEIPAILGPGDADLSYADLDAHADALARWLHNENVANGWNIAVCLTPTSWLPVAVLGILRAGDTCVPLDPRSAPDWIASRIAPSDVELIICDSGTESFFDGTAHRLLVLDQKWDTVSSASGGEKSKAAPDAFLLNGTDRDEAPALRSLSSKFVSSACEEAILHWSVEPGDLIGLQAGAGTGAFVETLLIGLLSGATLVLPDPSDPLNPADLSRLNHLRLSLDQWRGLAAKCAGDPTALPGSLRTICVEAGSSPWGSEKAWTMLRDVSALGILFFSPSGFSRAGISSTDFSGPLAVIDPPIGFATPGVEAALLDSAGHPLPPHFPGNLEISFPAQGTEKFPVPAWRDESGAFHLLPSETAATARALDQLPEIFDVHCIASPPTTWVVLAPKAEAPSPSAMRTATQRLPQELRPELFSFVKEFPLTPGGAIDEAKLPQPEAAPKSTPVTASLDKPTPSARTVAVVWEPLVLLQQTPDAPTLFLIHDLDGSPAPYHALVELLKSDWTIHGSTARGLQDPSACHLTVETEAAALVEAICLLDPEGPFHLSGHGFGAILAMEMARQLRIGGRSVPYLVLSGSQPPETGSDGSWRSTLSRFFSRPTLPPSPSSESPVVTAHRTALKNYRTQPLPGPVGVILGSDRDRDAESAWTQCAPEANIEHVNAPTAQMLAEPPVKRMTALMREWMGTSGAE